MRVPAVNSIFTAVFAAVAICFTAHADTIVFKSGEAMEGDVLKQDEAKLQLKVTYAGPDGADRTGTLDIPMEKILRIDKDTPEMIKEREEKAAADKELALKMKDEGKVRYRGKWVSEDEKKKEESKLADDKKVKQDKLAAAHKKAAEVAAAKKAEADKLQAAALAQQQKDDAAYAAQNNNGRNNWRNNSSSNPYGGNLNGLNGLNNSGNYNNNNNMNTNSLSNFRQ